MGFKRLNKELERLKKLYSINELSKDGKKILKELDLALSICASSTQLNERHKLDFEEYKNEWFENTEDIKYLDKLTKEIVDIYIILKKYQEYCERF